MTLVVTALRAPSGKECGDEGSHIDTIASAQARFGGGTSSWSGARDQQAQSTLVCTAELNKLSAPVPGAPTVVRGPRLYNDLTLPKDLTHLHVDVCAHDDRTAARQTKVF